MADDTETLLRRNLHEVFGERDAGRRQAAIAALFTQDCLIADPAGAHSGWSALDASVAALQARFPEFVFAEKGSAQAIPGAGRLAWSFGPAGTPGKITGLDVAVIRGDRIAVLYTFLD